MKTVTLVTGILAAWLALPAHAGHDSDLLRSSERLHHSAEAFSRSLDRHGAHRHVQRRADDVAHEARHLQRMVESGAHPRAIDRQLHRVEGRYLDLHRAFAHAHRVHHDRRVEHRFERLGAALSSLRVAVAGAPRGVRPEPRGRHDGYGFAWNRGY